MSRFLGLGFKASDRDQVNQLPGNAVEAYGYMVLQSIGTFVFLLLPLGFTEWVYNQTGSGGLGLAALLISLTCSTWLLIRLLSVAQRRAEAPPKE